MRWHFGAFALCTVVNALQQPKSAKVSNVPRKNTRLVSAHIYDSSGNGLDLILERINYVSCLYLGRRFP